MVGISLLLEVNVSSISRAGSDAWARVCESKVSLFSQGVLSQCVTLRKVLHRYADTKAGPRSEKNRLVQSPFTSSKARLARWFGADGKVDPYTRATKFSITQESLGGRCWRCDASVSPRLPVISRNAS